jgi:hypothetical protein
VRVRCTTGTNGGSGSEGRGEGGTVERNDDRLLRRQLVEVIRKGSAHAPFESVVKGLAPRLRGASHREVPYTPWQLVEHMRIAQWDILEFCRNGSHVSPPWPEGYWPETEAPPTGRAWQECIRSFLRDRKAMERLIGDPATDLFASVPHENGPPILREALLVADHNAYHLGQLVVLRRLLGAWPATQG